MKGRVRIDKLLVDRGLVETRSKAQALIMAGKVRVDGVLIDKAGAFVDAEAQVNIEEELKYVSRGGFKLEGAIKAFSLNFHDKVVIDIGASTGGFTDCALKHGAKRVYAVDVGYGQLDMRLRQDERVVVMERVNARYLKEGDFPEKFDMAVVDVSFISLEKIIPALIPLLKEEGEIVALVKPQFEAGRRFVKKGVVRDKEVLKDVLRKMADFARDAQLRICGVCESPIKGPAGNREFFMLLAKGEGEQIEEVEGIIECVVEEERKHETD